MKTITKLLFLLLFPIITFGQISTLPHSTDFEVGFGDWTNSTSDNFDWSQTTTETPTSGTGPQVGPPYGNLGSNGYVFTESSPKKNQKKQAWLECEYDLSMYSNTMFTFAYHMYSANGGAYGPGTLQLDVYDGTSWVFNVWSNSISDPSWQNGLIDLSAYDGLSQVILSWTGATAGYQSDISLDNLIVTGNTLKITSYPYEADFETEVQHSTTGSDIGFTFAKTGWRNTSGDGADWRADAGGTPSVTTGPGDGTSTGQSDQTPGTSTGFYLYFESSTPNYPNVNAYLLTPIFDLTSNAFPILEFWYNMYGSDMGSLKLQASIDGGNTWSADLMVLSGDRGIGWKQIIFDMVDYRGETNLVFRLEAESSTGWFSDVCIDNFRVLDMSSSPLGVCCNNINLASDAFSTVGSVVNIMGTNPLTITSNGFSFSTLNMDNSSGVVLIDELTTDKLSLLNGVIDATAAGIVVKSTLWGAIDGGSATSFVYGVLRRHIGSNTDTYVFPIGDGLGVTNYHKIDMINNNMTGVTYINASVADMVGGNNLELNTSEQTTPILEMADKEWFLTPDAQPGIGDYGVNLYLNDLSGASLIDNNFTVVKRPNGSITYGDWDAFDATTTIPTAGNNGRTMAGGYSQKNGFSSFSGFGVGGSGGGPLPIELLSFNAELNGDNVDVYWSVASQINNDYYSILRSVGGFDWLEIGIVNGDGNSNYRIDYKFTDENPHIGVSYYKLKQTDFDGVYEEFTPVSISYSVEVLGLLIAPNPVTDIISLTIDGKIQNDLHVIKIFDSRGNVILSNNLIGHLKDYKLDVRELSYGAYIIKVKNKRQLSIGRFIKE